MGLLPCCSNQGLLLPLLPLLLQWGGVLLLPLLLQWGGGLLLPLLLQPGGLLQLPVHRREAIWGDCHLGIFFFCTHLFKKK